MLCFDVLEPRCDATADAQSAKAYEAYILTSILGTYSRKHTIPMKVMQRRKVVVSAHFVASAQLSLALCAAIARSV